MEPAISVIIPMYNTEKYIGECLSSLANQTFQNFEFIVVDDCSTDDSRKVVQSFFASFGDRLTLAKLSEHVGLPGIVRNFALNMARGKYIYFIDSDDFIAPDTLENLYAVAEKFSEKCFRFPDEFGKESRKVESYQTGKFVTAPTLETFDIGARVEGFTQKRFLWWACNKLFRRKFLRDNKITFPAIKAWEDFVFTLECIIAAKNYVRVPFVSYYYRIRKSSLSQGSSCGAQFLENSLRVIKSVNDCMNGKNFFKDNPRYKYMVMDLFMQNHFDNVSPKFISGAYDLGEVYDSLCTEIFSQRPQDNIELTAYLYILANFLKGQNS